MDVLDFQELRDLDGSLVDPEETDIFSMFLQNEVHSPSDSSLSPTSAHSSSPATSPIPSFGDASSSLFDQDTMAAMPSLCNDMYTPMNMEEIAVKEEGNESDSDSDESSQPRRTNKRNFTAMESSVTLTREELRNMSSKGLEEYAAKLAATRQLTKSEERALKRQRRLVKNRESAQLSRARKKMYVEELERKVNTISVHSERMAAQMAHLAAENKSLKEQVYMLQNALKRQQQQQQQPLHNGQDGVHVVQMEHEGSSGPSSPASVGSPLSGDERENSGTFSPLSSLDTMMKTRLTQNARTAGMCLFIVLLSFGMFFSATTLGPAGPAMPTIVRREPIPEVFPQGFQQGYTGRTLKALGGNGMVSGGTLSSSFGGGGAVAVEVENVVDENPSAVSVSVERYAPASSTSQSSGHQVLCTEAYKLGVEDSTGAAFRGHQPQPTFTIVLPPSALEGAVPNVDKIADGQLLEVGCRILSLNVVPSFDDLPMLGNGEPDRVVIPTHHDMIARA